MNLKFFPDYTSNDKYQTILYSQSKKNKFNVSPLQNPFNVSKETDIIHFHWINAVWKMIDFEPKEFVSQGFPGLFDYKKNGTKTIWTIHNTLPHETKDIKSEIDLMQKFSDESDIIHIMLKEGLEEIEKYIKIDHKKIFFHQNSSYSSVLKNKESKKNNRLKLNIPEESVVIGSVGKIRPYKNVQLLLDAYLDLYKKNKDVYLLIAGLNKDNEAVEKIKKAAENNKKIILIERFIPDEEFSEISSILDIAVYTYKDILNSGSAYTSFSFNHYVVLPEFNALKSLSNLNFISFFKSDSSVDLSKTLYDIIKFNKYKKFELDVINWNLENTSKKMSDGFFKKIKEYLI